MEAHGTFGARGARDGALPWLRFSSGECRFPQDHDVHHEVEVFLRQVAGFLNTTNRISRIVNRVEVFLRQSAGFLSTTNRLKIMR